MGKMITVIMKMITVIGKDDYSDKEMITVILLVDEATDLALSITEIDQETNL